MTPKQEAFVREYAIDHNATQAAIRAGYSGKTAGQIGEQNLRKLEIAAAIDKGAKEHAERCAVTVDSITKQLEDDRQLARESNQASAAIAASMGMAKLHGLITDKSENLNRNLDISDKPVEVQTGEEWENEFTPGAQAPARNTH